MNKFDVFFFQRYLPTWVKIKGILQKHIITILGKIFLNYFFWVLIPTFIYYISDTVKSFVPFFVLEIFIFIMFLKIMYDIFNWYNDVWIITNEWVVELDWELFWVNSVSVKYGSIEWIEIVQNGIIDTIFGKWTLIIHKIWGGWDNFMLEDAAVPYQAIDEIEKMSREQREQLSTNDEDVPPANYENLLQALSWIVEQYMTWNGFQKNQEEENKQFIEKVKKQKWTIDIR